MQPILSKLDGGDRRSIGRSNEVASEVLAGPGLLDAAFSGLLTDNPLLLAGMEEITDHATRMHRK